MPISEHPWPLLEKAAARGLGITLTAGQVVELFADYAAVVEKNNELLNPGRETTVADLLGNV